MGTVGTFFCISREKRNRELPITVLQKCIPGTNAFTITLLYYKNAFQVQMLLRSRTLPGGNKPFWKVLRQTNAYVSNKWVLKFPCSYLNTQGSGPFGNPLKRIDDG
ncbi:hypothetical protein T03_2283 [Trichinella britovi]|uniref:Uncharacterized protein n=1 Tax=Trichinella britovi TaxID=45882 RepID=A0A0V1D8W0_TRIBR|nr:hypothetical protein T03_2283 [Trichinella britovi]